MYVCVYIYIYIYIYVYHRPAAGAVLDRRGQVAGGGGLGHAPQVLAGAVQAAPVILLRLVDLLPPLGDPRQVRVVVPAPPHVVVEVLEEVRLAPAVILQGGDELPALLQPLQVRHEPLYNVM